MRQTPHGVSRSHGSIIQVHAGMALPGAVGASTATGSSAPPGVLPSEDGVSSFALVLPTRLPGSVEYPGVSAKRKLKRSTQALALVHAEACGSEHQKSAGRSVSAREADGATIGPGALGSKRNTLMPTAQTKTVQALAPAIKAFETALGTMADGELRELESQMRRLSPEQVGSARRVLQSAKIEHRLPDQFTFLTRSFDNWWTQGLATKLAIVDHVVGLSHSRSCLHDSVDSRAASKVIERAWSSRKHKSRVTKIQPDVDAA